MRFCARGASGLRAGCSPRRPIARARSAALAEDVPARETGSPSFLSRAAVCKEENHRRIGPALEGREPPGPALHSPQNKRGRSRRESISRALRCVYARRLKRGPQGGAEGSRPRADSPPRAASSPREKRDGCAVRLLSPPLPLAEEVTAAPVRGTPGGGLRPPPGVPRTGASRSVRRCSPERRSPGGGCAPGSRRAGPYSQRIQRSPHSGAKLWR